MPHHVAARFRFALRPLALALPAALLSLAPAVAHAAETAASEHSSIGPEIRVSLPIMNTGCSCSRPKKLVAARPNKNAISGVNSKFAIPRTPSVPKSFPM